jgi:hypothetical protein
MAGVYSVRFYGAHDLTGLATYTVPTGFVAIVRDFDAFWGVSTAGAEVNLYGHAGQVIYQAAFGLNDVGWRGWRGRQVLNAGETLQIFTSDAMDVTLSGYLLTSP